MRLVMWIVKRRVWSALAVSIIASGALISLVDAQAQRRPRGARAAQSTSAPASQPTTTQATTRPTATAPKLVPLSFNNAQIDDIARFLTEQFGKPVIITNDKVKQKRVTITNPKPLPAADAMDVLRTALQDNGIAIEERDLTVHLIAIEDVLQAQLRTLGVDEDVVAAKPANQIVRKYFALRYYDPEKMAVLIKPLLPEYSAKSVTPDSASGKLMIVAPIERLRIIAGVIRELDAPDSSGGEMRVFPIKNVDVNEILPMLERLVSSYLGVAVKAGQAPSAQPQDRSSSDNYYDRYSGRYYGGSRSGSGSTATVAPSGPVVVKGDKNPVMLIPDARRSSLIVVGPSKVLTQIEKWLKELDQPKPPSAEWELVDVQYGDPQELVGELMNTLNSMPDESLRSAIRILPFGSSRKIMIIGSEQNRSLVKKWLADIDVPAGTMETKTVELKNADAQEIAQNIKELFQQMHPYSGRYGDFSSYYGMGGGSDRSKVTVTANTRNNSVTISASPDRMEKIIEQIRVWDKPLEGEEAKPRIYDLKYADPEKTKTLLESLFTKKESEGGSWRDYLFGDGATQTPSPVGRLFGQFRFEAYSDTGKLIAVSKNEENYKIVDEMIAEIDRPQSGGLPRVIQLKFADAETLAEQLNALLNAPGTPASILRRGQTGTFKELEDKGSPYGNDQSNNAQNRNQPQNPQQPGGNAGQMQFWWQSSHEDILKNRQPSNLVGKLRIVPNVEQNLLMVVAPKEFADDIEAFVAKLDRPGQQVLIKALIAEITHDDQMSLGYRFSSDPTAFGVNADTLLTDNALNGLLTYNFQDFFGHQNAVTFKLDINNLLSLLRRKTDLKIRSEPKVFTADNVEAEFFDGQDIPFITNSTVSGVTAGQTQSFDYKAVGIRLRVRPHITKERNIDLTVNLLVSNIGAQRIFNFAVVDRRETTTRIVLQDGHTFLISGILREEDRKINTGIPGLQDIPGIGEVFKHHQVAKVNSEILIFLTPYVIGPQDPHTPIESGPLDKLREKLGCSKQFSPIERPAEEVPANQPTEMPGE